MCMTCCWQMLHKDASGSCIEFLLRLRTVNPVSLTAVWWVSLCDWWMPMQNCNMTKKVLLLYSAVLPLKKHPALTMCGAKSKHINNSFSLFGPLSHDAVIQKLCVNQKWSARMFGCLSCVRKKNKSVPQNKASQTTTSSTLVLNDFRVKFCSKSFNITGSAQTWKSSHTSSVIRNWSSGW